MRGAHLGTLLCGLLVTVAGCMALDPGAGGGSGADADGSEGGAEWSGDTEIGVKCRLVLPEGGLVADEDAAIEAQYRLLNPSRFNAVEVELDPGLRHVSGDLREDDLRDENVTLRFTVEPEEEGEHVIHAVFVWNEDAGGRREVCHTFNPHVAAS